MADDPKGKPPSEIPRQVAPKPVTEARDRPFAEPPPLDVVVVQTQPAAVDVDTVVEAPTWIPERLRVPGGYWLLLAIAAILMIYSWHWIYSPLVARSEHFIQRQVTGEKEQYAPTSEPHTRRQKPGFFGHRLW